MSHAQAHVVVPRIAYLGGMSDTRRKILERRARFIGAALAGLTGCGGETLEEPRDASSDAVLDTRDSAIVDSAFDVVQAEACLSAPLPHVGGACTTDTDCDPSGVSGSQCSLTAFTVGPLMPTPTCVNALECPITDSASVQRCADDGVCSRGVCFPKCTFGSDGLAPKGCIGKNGCIALGKNVGACIGGCATDADCPAPSRCQRETGYCVNSLVTYPRGVGAACTKVEMAVCNCMYPPGATAGYCTTACRAGTSSCPAGFACDVGLPLADYPSVPVGLLGHCAKQCTSDAECPAGTCAENAGTGRICVVGPELRAVP